MSILLDTILSHHHWISDAIADMTLIDQCQESIFAICGASTVKIFDFKDANNPKLLRVIDLSGFGAMVKNLVCKDDLVAIAVQGEETQEPGRVLFYKSDGTFLSEVQVSSTPESLAFTSDGQEMVVNNGKGVDVDDSQSTVKQIVIDLRGKVEWLTQRNVSILA